MTDADATRAGRGPPRRGAAATSARTEWRLLRALLERAGGGDVAAIALLLRPRAEARRRLGRRRAARAALARRTAARGTPGAGSAGPDRGAESAAPPGGAP